MPLSEAKKKAQIKYNKKAKTQFSLSFHNVNDADIIEKLKGVKSKNDYVRQLIRKDLEKNF